MAQDTVFSVAEFNEYIGIFLDRVGDVYVEGEISELKINHGKWVWITIKDDEASVSVFGTTFQIRNFRALDTGMKVRIHGRPKLYQKTGRFSIYAREIIPTGEGALQMAFEKLKLQLTEEGLFDPARKRPLPEFPETIGLLTARGSQAYNDFVKILQERMGGLRVIYYPVQVQGREAIGSILRALEYFQKKGGVEVLVLCRGGGSLDDLAAFNDEQVVRAVFSARVPVVCGVGHEGDVSLCDLAVDVRASTPSNAAELLVRHREDLLKMVRNQIEAIDWRIGQLILDNRQLIQSSVIRIEGVFKQQIYEFNLMINQVYRWIETTDQRLKQMSKDFQLKGKRILELVEWKLEDWQTKLKELQRLLYNLDYRQTLARGFSITFREDGKIVRSADQVSAGSKLTTRLAMGEIDSVVS